MSMVQNNKPHSNQYHSGKMSNQHRHSNRTANTPEIGETALSTTELLNRVTLDLKSNMNNSNVLLESISALRDNFEYMAEQMSEKHKALQTEVHKVISETEVIRKTDLVELRSDINALKTEFFSTTRDISAIKDAVGELLVSFQSLSRDLPSKQYGGINPLSSCVSEPSETESTEIVRSNSQSTAASAAVSDDTGVVDGASVVSSIVSKPRVVKVSNNSSDNLSTNAIQEVVGDDLRVLKGVGPVVYRKLKDYGIVRFRQIAFPNEREKKILASFIKLSSKNNWQNVAESLITDEPSRPSEIVGEK